MTKDVLSIKLECIRKCLSRIRERLPASPDDLATNLDAQDIIIINLERTVQLSVDIASHIIAETDIPPPQTMGESFLILANINIIPRELANRLRKAVGFRNLAVHNYQCLDWNIVFSICTNELSAFEEFIALLSQRYL